MAATVGQQDVNKVCSKHPDVILLDMNLPVMEGWTEASEIKKGPGTVSVPIAASTARTVSGNRNKALAVTKPLRPWLQPGGVPDGSGRHSWPERSRP